MAHDSVAFQFVNIEELYELVERVNIDLANKEARAVVFDAMRGYRERLSNHLASYPYLHRAGSGRGTGRGTLQHTPHRRTAPKGRNFLSAYVGLNNRAEEAVAVAERYASNRSQSIVPNPSWIDAGTNHRAHKGTRAAKVLEAGGSGKGVSGYTGKIAGTAFITNFRRQEAPRVAMAVRESMLKYLEQKAWKK